MQFVVTKTSTVSQQIAVEAETPEAAEELAKKGEGNRISRSSNEQFNVQPRPVPQPAGAAMAGGQFQPGVRPMPQRS